MKLKDLASIEASQASFHQGATSNTAKGGIGGAKEGGCGIIGALVVATLALGKGVAMVDVDVTT